MSTYTSHKEAPKDKDGRPLYGMDIELAKKKSEKHDVEKEAEVMNWIQAVTGDRFDTSDVKEALKDGQTLCKLINTVKPGTIKKINSGRLSYLCMENLHVFSKACQGMGLPARETFAEADLFEGKNIPWVIECLHSFAQLVQSKSTYKGPKLGVKVSPRRHVPKALPQRTAPPAPSTGNSSSSSSSSTGGGATRPPPPRPNHAAAAPTTTGGRSSSGGSLDDLVKLADLRDKGIITNQEFELKKKQILGL